MPKKSRDMQLKFSSIFFAGCWLYNYVNRNIVIEAGAIVFRAETPSKLLFINLMKFYPFIKLSFEKNKFLLHLILITICVSW